MSTQFTKEEIYNVLQLASNFHNEHTSLPFTASEIPDAVYKSLVATYSELLVGAKASTRAFGFGLREFANESIPVVVKAIAAPVEVVKVSKKKEVEPVVIAEPVAVEEVIEVAPVVEEVILE